MSRLTLSLTLLSLLALGGCASTERASTLSRDYTKAQRCLKQAEPKGSSGPIALSESALQLCTEVCDTKLAAGCWAIARHHLAQSPSKRDEALALFETACAYEDGASCVEAGLLTDAGTPGHPGDSTKAVGWFKRACDLGHGAGCANYGLIMQRGEVVPKDEVRAAQYYQRACAQHDAVACANYAYLMHYGLGISTNDARARELYEESCQAGVSYACANLAQMKLAGRGGPADESAVRTYETLCEAGNPEACTSLGILYEYGVSRAIDLQQAKSLYAPACDANVADACLGLARITEGEVGNDIERLREVARHYRRVCLAFRDREACERLDKLSPKLHSN